MAWVALSDGIPPSGTTVLCHSTLHGDHRYRTPVSSPACSQDTSIALPAGYRAPIVASTPAATPSVLGNPTNYNRAVPLTFTQFRFGFANAISRSEAHELYETFAVPASGVPLFQSARLTALRCARPATDTVS